MRTCARVRAKMSKFQGKVPSGFSLISWRLHPIPCKLFSPAPIVKVKTAIFAVLNE